ncbi:MAG: amino acid--tRNA ligase-related protein [Alphaproteobacteria bacterium]
MSTARIIRVTNVEKQAGEQLVTYYMGAQQYQWPWQGTAPLIGDVLMINPLQPDEEPRLIASAKQGSWNTENNDALRWRAPFTTESMSRLDVLHRRHLMRRAVRHYLDEQGFIEIDAPLLVQGASPDIAINSFSVGERYLVSSTEYQLKRLAIGGIEKLYSLTQNFREGDSSQYRNPEFTMLEWGRVGSKIADIEDDAEAMILQALQSLELPTTIDYQGHQINVKRPWQRLSVLAAIHHITGVAMDDFDVKNCHKTLAAIGYEIRPDWAENQIFLFSLILDHVQPQLGLTQPVFLNQWPFFQTTSATPDVNDPTLACRSQLFIGGIELSDGFAGLADADMQWQLFNNALNMRAHEGQKAVALDKKYLAAMQLGAPHGAGMAMGFDRLVMLLTNQPHIRHVLAFNWDEL